MKKVMLAVAALALTANTALAVSNLGVNEDLYKPLGVGDNKVTTQTERGAGSTFDGFKTKDIKGDAVPGTNGRAPLGPR